MKRMFQIGEIFVIQFLQKKFNSSTTNERTSDDDDDDDISVRDERGSDLRIKLLRLLNFAIQRPHFGIIFWPQKFRRFDAFVNGPVLVLCCLPTCLPV